MGQLDVSDLLADRHLRGPEFCEALTDRIDGFLAGVFAAAEAPEGTALVAVGGYRTARHPRKTGNTFRYIHCEIQYDPRVLCTVLLREVRQIFYVGEP